MILEASVGRRRQETMMAFGLFGKKNKKSNALVVVSYEGSGRMRLNGVKIQEKKIKTNAQSHPQTVCWVEFTHDGARIDQGRGPEAGKLPPEKLERLFQELPMTPECRTVLATLAKGEERAGQWLAWGSGGSAKRGTAGDQGSRG